MAAEMNNNMEQKNIELNEQEKEAAQAAVNQTVPPAPAAAEAPAVPEKKRIFSKGSKSRKIAQGIGFGILGTLAAGLIGGLIFKLGESSGEKKADANVIDGSFTDVTDTPPADDSAPFDNNTDNF